MKLNVNVDHVATLRNARGGKVPDPVKAALIVEKSGANGITVHLREDRRHIKDDDVMRLRKLVKTKLNLEMAATKEIINIAKKIKPDWSTIVPEKRKELTTEGGLDVRSQKNYLKDVISELHEKKILISLFVDPDLGQIETAKEINADFIEIHTGKYADENNDKEFLKIVKGALFAKKVGLIAVCAGHGLNYENVKKIAQIKEIEELSIGHSIISRAIFVGLGRAVKEMLNVIARYSRSNQ